MILRFPLESLPAHCVGRGPGFADAVLAAAKIEGGQIVIPITDWQHLVREHVTGKTSGPPEPTVAALATNFAGALSRWTAAGFPTVSPEVYAFRSGVCDACQYWDPAARFGLGKCNAPGCGCTSLKRWLATEKCPLDRWPAQSSAASS